MENPAEVQPTNGEQEIRPPGDALIGEMVIGQVDPKTLSREQLDSSDERLFHGSSIQRK